MFDNGGGGGLFSQLFTERSIVLLIFGALGGAVRSATLRTGWREGVRVTFVGSATAFGVGELTPVLLRPWLGDLPSELSGTIGVVSALAFIMGLLAVVVVERLLAGKVPQNEAKD